MEIVGQERVRNQPTPEGERRGPPRTRVLIPALAVCEDGAEFRCIVRDMSLTGAKIGVSARYRLPKRFKLITDNRRQGYPVKLVWQRGEFAGLALDLPMLG